MQSIVQNPSIKKRDGSIDAMKFLLICMVIFDHCAVKFSMHKAPYYEHVYQLFQAINMPIFVFISGFFMRRTADRRKFYKGILSIFETYIVFQSIILFQRCFNGNFNLINLIKPGWAMWYLPALMIWRIVAYELPETIISKKGYFLFFLYLCSLSAGFIPVKETNVQRIVTYAPMFFIGFYCGKTNILNRIRKINFFIPLFIILAYFILLFVINVHTTPLFYQNQIYNNPYATVMTSFESRIFWHIITLIIGASAASLILRIKNKWMAEMGMHTLLFYVGHIAFLNIFCSVVKKMGLLQPNIIYMLLMFLVIIVFFTILSKFKWHKYILNPVSNLLASKS